MEHQAVVEFVGPWTGPLVATSVHAGHDLRPEIAAAMTLPEADRFREEDPFTDLIAGAVESRMLTHRSRFEVELITDFVDDLGGKAVLKPLQGSGGSGVFLINSAESPNLNQIIEAISRDGYVVAQEYLPEATEGDVRLFVMNGRPLEVDGKYAAFRRLPSAKDVRSNMSVGGKAAKAKVTDDMLHMVDVVRPKLVADGMFVVGLDIVGDKLMEINVFSPGGLGSAQSLVEVDFAPIIIEELERKVRIRKHNPGLDNRSLATS